LSSSLPRLPALSWRAALLRCVGRPMRELARTFRRGAGPFASAEHILILSETVAINSSMHASGQ
jgi:hypothetical protein